MYGLAARRFARQSLFVVTPQGVSQHGYPAPTVPPKAQTTVKVPPAARTTGTVVLLMGGTPMLRIAGGPAPTLWHSSPLDSNIVEEQDDVAADGTNGWTLTTAEATFTASGGPWRLARTKFLATAAADSGIVLADGESCDATMTIAGAKRNCRIRETWNWCGGS